MNLETLARPITDADLAVEIERLYRKLDDLWAGRVYRLIPTVEARLVEFLTEQHRRARQASR